MFDSVHELRTHGFSGFARIAALTDTRCRALPCTAGVYMVVRPDDWRRVILKRNPAGRFEEKDPTEDPSQLRKRWIPKAIILYIGMAGDGRLRKRIDEFMQFGSGRPVGHRGGRSIWQLDNAADLLVCWKETSPESARAIEADYIAAFKRAFGARPFANQKD